MLRLLFVAGFAVLLPLTILAPRATSGDEQQAGLLLRRWEEPPLRGRDFRLHDGVRGHIRLAWRRPGPSNRRGPRRAHEGRQESGWIEI